MNNKKSLPPENYDSYETQKHGVPVEFSGNFKGNSTSPDFFTDTYGDFIPQYCTLALADPDVTDDEDNADSPSDEAVSETRAWSIENKL